MSENERRKEELIRRLDNLEACKDNPVYLAEIKKIRKELADINCEQQPPQRMLAGSLPAAVLWVEFTQKIKNMEERENENYRKIENA